MSRAASLCSDEGFPARKVRAVAAGESRGEASVEAILRLGGRRARRKELWLLGISALACAGVALSLAWGPAGPDLGGLWASLDGADAQARAMVWMLRAPRLTIGVLAGFGLGVAGCVAQAVLRNPLASPFTLGVSSGAAFGAALGMLLWPAGPAAAVPAMAIAASLLTSSVALAVTRMPNASNETLVLAGVAVMFLFSALNSYIQYTAPQMDLHRLVFWSFGSLAKAGWSEILVAGLMILPPVPWFLVRAWDLNLLTCGDETARSLGVRVGRLKVLCIVFMSVMSAGAICFCGVIGFIGLVAPHMARLVLGHDHRFLLPGAGLLGAALVILADLAGRALYAPLVIPVGIMTSFLGVPFFFWLLTRRALRTA